MLSRRLGHILEFVFHNQINEVFQVDPLSIFHRKEMTRSLPFCQFDHQV